MASSKPTDEILAALPELGLLVWRLDQGSDWKWHAVLEDTTADPLAYPCGDGDTAAAALIEALGKAGIRVEDSP